MTSNSTVKQTAEGSIKCEADKVFDVTKKENGTYDKILVQWKSEWVVYVNFKASRKLAEC